MTLYDGYDFEPREQWWDMTAYLNELGAAGWWVVHLQRDGNDMFKRRWDAVLSREIPADEHRDILPDYMPVTREERAS